MFCDRQKKLLEIFLGLVLLFVLTGCLRKVEVVTRERLDQELTGNRGVLYGSVPTTPSQASPTREYVEWDIEVPTYEVSVRIPEWRRRTEDKALWGNQGYLTGGPRATAKGRVIPSEPQKPVARPLPRPFFAPPETEKALKPAQAAYTTYIVKKGDTLGSISSHVYGTSKAWKDIYEANRNVLEDPGRLYPGQILRIPPREGKSQQPSKGTIK